jgi:putative ABC transport system permease protein
MKTIDIIRRSGRSLRQAKARTLLTSLAIGVGAFTLTLALAAGEGARQYADKIVTSNVNPQALIVGKDKSLFGGQAGQQTAPREYDPNATTFGGARGGGGITLSRLTEQDITSIAKLSGVKKVEPMYDVTIRYMYAADYPTKKYTAAVTTYNPSILVETTAGKVPPLNNDIKADEVTIPDAYAKALGFKNAQDAIGKKIVLHLERAANVKPEEIQQIIVTQGFAGLQNLKTTDATEVTLTVIATTNVSSLSFQRSDSIAVPAAKAKEMAEFLTTGTNDYQKYLLASVTAKDGVKPEDVKAALTSKGYNARTAKDIQSLLFQVVNILQGVVAGFGVLALIASVFGIINTQYISVLERTQQIGLMKALGMRRRDVGRLFKIEAAWIGFLGGVIGSTAAVIVGTAINPWITKTLTLGDGVNLLIFQPLPIVALIVGLMVVAVGAGILPARKAATLDPIEALRTE